MECGKKKVEMEKLINNYQWNDLIIKLINKIK